MLERTHLQFSLVPLLKAVFKKATEDGLITAAEADMLYRIQADAEQIENAIATNIKNGEALSVLRKQFRTAVKALVTNAVNVAAIDGMISDEEHAILEVLNTETGLLMTQIFSRRMWFIFKICVVIGSDISTPILLDVFDNSYCFGHLNPSSGLCLGTKHYTIQGVDITLLTFSLQEGETREWIQRGAYATINFTNPEEFKADLEKTANLLFEKHVQPELQRSE